MTWYDDRLAISLFCRKIMMRSVSQVLLSWDQGVINKSSTLRFHSENFLHFCEQHIHHRDHIREISFIKLLNSRGISKDNCGTPADASVQMEKTSSTLISLVSVWFKTYYDFVRVTLNCHPYHRTSTLTSQLWYVRQSRVRCHNVYTQQPVEAKRAHFF